MDATQLQIIDDKIEGVKELFDAKLEGVEGQIGGVKEGMTRLERVVERLAAAVEEQIKTNTRVAVLENSHGHLKGNVRFFQDAATAKFMDHDLRIGKVERVTASNTWRLNSQKALWGAIGSGAAVASTFVVDHFDKITGIFKGA